ncbi:hypothetical protein EXIGLDRAFT_842511 [Exidia glandulosa HHB12029]|uniref:Uncharacterized protein n=1 Tax=Exidia glandulosa HHB12029 TaxID=1314781 RepID=A0A165D8P8_EXIGL|nr:hypothetical protein EXIGLDRAFT_842511 [Exidia glandulosa HHB12029]
MSLFRRRGRRGRGREPSPPSQIPTDDERVDWQEHNRAFQLFLDELAVQEQERRAMFVKLCRTVTAAFHVAQEQRQAEWVRTTREMCKDDDSAHEGILERFRMAERDRDERSTRGIAACEELGTRILDSFTYLHTRMAKISYELASSGGDPKDHGDLISDIESSFAAAMQQAYAHATERSYSVPLRQYPIVHTPWRDFPRTSHDYAPKNTDLADIQPSHDHIARDAERVTLYCDINDETTFEELQERRCAAWTAAEDVAAGALASYRAEFEALEAQHARAFQDFMVSGLSDQTQGFESTTTLVLLRFNTAEARRTCEISSSWTTWVHRAGFLVRQHLGPGRRLWCHCYDHNCGLHSGLTPLVGGPRHSFLPSTNTPFELAVLLSVPKPRAALPVVSQAVRRRADNHDAFTEVLSRLRALSSDREKDRRAALEGLLSWWEFSAPLAEIPRTSFFQTELEQARAVAHSRISASRIAAEELALDLEEWFSTAQGVREDAFRSLLASLYSELTAAFDEALNALLALQKRVGHSSPQPM